MSSSPSHLRVGDKVRYTRSAFKRLEPPNDQPGEVIEVEGDPVHSVIVQWPYGRADEYAKDVRRV